MNICFFLHLRYMFSMIKTVLPLYATINNLRLSASMMYDKAMAKGLKMEEVSKVVKPIREQLDHTIAMASLRDLGGLIFAAKSLENQADQHGKDAMFLMEKAANASAYVEKIHTAIISMMRQRKMNEIIDGDFSAILVESNGQFSLRLR